MQDLIVNLIRIEKGVFLHVNDLEIHIVATLRWPHQAEGGFDVSHPRSLFIGPLEEVFCGLV